MQEHPIRAASRSALAIAAAVLVGAGCWDDIKEPGSNSADEAVLPSQYDTAAGVGTPGPATAPGPAGTLYPESLPPVDTLRVPAPAPVPPPGQ